MTTDPQDLLQSRITGQLWELLYIDDDQIAHLIHVQTQEPQTTTYDLLRRYTVPVPATR